MKTATSDDLRAARADEATGNVLAACAVVNMITVGFMYMADSNGAALVFSAFALACGLAAWGFWILASWRRRRVAEPES